AFDRIFLENLEERLSRHVAQRQLAIIELFDDRILILFRKLGEDLSIEGLAAMIVERRDCGAIELRGRMVRLIALFIGALCKRPLHVPAITAAVESSELVVDEIDDACFARARTGLVRWNET